MNTNISIQDNPFTPTFGEAPSHLAGRAQLTTAIERALTSASRRPELTSLFYGARGTGKTTLLSITAHLAQEAGWIPVRAAALPGMLDDIEITARKTAAHLLKQPSSKHISRFGVPNVVDIEVTKAPDTASNWRSRMTAILDELESQNSGIVITVDEIDPNLDELAILASVYQIFVSEGRRIALFMAGLPNSTSQLLSSQHVSFLRRAQLTRLTESPTMMCAKLLSKQFTTADVQFVMKLLISPLQLLMVLLISFSSSVIERGTFTPINKKLPSTI